MLKTGIIGLPNVGKSTLFNAITKSHVIAANYPFATIDPNVGIVKVKDERVDKLAEIYKPLKKIYTTFEFIDIAGLVRGASKGEGLGNQFLSNIREVDAICQVVRCFKDTNVIHVDGSIDPIRDVETINIELALADLEIIDRRILKLAKRVQVKEEDALVEFNVLSKIKTSLDQNQDPKKLKLTELEQKTIRNFNFLTLKPIIYLANLGDSDILDISANKEYQGFLNKMQETQEMVIPVSIKLEEEIANLDTEEERDLFLNEYGLKKSTLDDIIIKTYELLNLKTFFTVGPDEVRAWTFKNGMKAPECAGLIHTDFQKGFIKAETVSFDDLMKAGNYLKAKEQGNIRLEGKEYLVKDGDVMLFRFNV
jgi:GTP-binding protein YchF